jgi:DNA-binding GntR family transcriptional regulator
MSVAEHQLVSRDGREVERAFDALMEEIMSGALSPGLKLNEPELTQRLGIKRGPLREAIRRLQGRNLVLCTPNFGARIVVHSPEEILDIYEMREAMESMAARLCAERMTEEEIENLNKAAPAASFYDGVNEIERQGRTSFHLQIIRGSRNSAIVRTLDESFFQLLKLWRKQYPWLRHSDDRARLDHRRIAEAIALRDAASAELLMRNHIRRLRDLIDDKRQASFATEGSPGDD